MSPQLARIRQSLSRGPLRAALPGILASLALLPVMAQAGGLRAGGDHAFEDHAFEDHSRENLLGVDLEGADLTEIDLSESGLKNAYLVDALLEAADLTDAFLQNTDLDGADLRDARVDFAFAKNASFTGALLNGASLVGANLKNTDFSGASLLGADLSDLGDVKNAIFDGAYYDADTRLDPRIDVSGMIEVTGSCPGDPDAMLVIESGASDCARAEALPEPSAATALAWGGALLVALARRRR